MKLLSQVSFNIYKRGLNIIERNRRNLILRKKMSDITSFKDKPPLGAIQINPPNATKVIEDRSNNLYTERSSEEIQIDTDKSISTSVIDVLESENILDKTCEKSVLPTNGGTDKCPGCPNEQSSHVSVQSLAFPQFDVLSDQSVQAVDLISIVNSDTCTLSDGHINKKSSSSSETTKPISQEVVKKKTVLPKKLLDNVTDLIKQQKVKLPSEHKRSHKQTCSKEGEGMMMNVSGDQGVYLDLDLSTDRHSDLEVDQPQTHENILENMSNNFSQAKDDSLNEETIIEKDCRPEMSEVKPTSDSLEAGFIDDISESGDELLFPDLFEELDTDRVEKETVYDISSLFTGELDRRYKSEKKKVLKGKGKNYRHKSKGKQGPDDEERGGDETKNKKPVPNYFIAIQIKDKQIHDALHKVQQEVLTGNQLLSPAMIRLAKLHLTLMVLRLDTEDDLTKSKSALDNVMEKLGSTYLNKSLKLCLSGLGNFRNEIVFANIKEQEQIDELRSIADVVEDGFLAQDLVSADKRGFKPHITVMKLSKAKHLRKTGIKKIEEKLYQKYKCTEFGVEDVRTLQLCSMMKTDSTGYYLVEHQVHFPSGLPSVDDSGYGEIVADQYENTESNLDSKHSTEDTHRSEYGLSLSKDIECPIKQSSCSGDEMQVTTYSAEILTLAGVKDIEETQDLNCERNIIEKSIGCDKSHETKASCDAILTPEEVNREGDTIERKSVEMDCDQEIEMGDKIINCDKSEESKTSSGVVLTQEQQSFEEANNEENILSTVDLHQEVEIAGKSEGGSLDSDGSADIKSQSEEFK